MKCVSIAANAVSARRILHANRADENELGEGEKRVNIDALAQTPNQLKNAIAIAFRMIRLKTLYRKPIVNPIYRFPFTMAKSIVFDQTLHLWGKKTQRIS